MKTQLSAQRSGAELEKQNNQKTTSKPNAVASGWKGEIRLPVNMVPFTALYDPQPYFDLVAIEIVQRCAVRQDNVALAGIEILEALGGAVGKAGYLSHALYKPFIGVECLFCFGGGGHTHLPAVETQLVPYGGAVSGGDDNVVVDIGAVGGVKAFFDLLSCLTAHICCGNLRKLVMTSLSTVIYKALMYMTLVSVVIQNHALNQEVISLPLIV